MDYLIGKIRQDITLSILFLAAIQLQPKKIPGEQISSRDLAAHAAWVKGQKEVVELKAMFSKPSLNKELLADRREFHTLQAGGSQSAAMKNRCAKEIEQILHFMLYEQEGFQKNKKNKPHKAVRGGKGKERNKMAMLITMFHLLLNLRLLHHLRRITQQRTPSVTNVVKLGTGEGTVPCISPSLRKKPKLASWSYAQGYTEVEAENARRFKSIRWRWSIRAAD
ncbi:hypothetical protein Tco_0196798 [Tanacetum coccineum]